MDAAPAMPMVDAASAKQAASSAKRILGFEFTGEYYRPKREKRLCRERRREMGLYLPVQGS